MNPALDYFKWHYTHGQDDVKNFSKNILRFTWDFFSIPLQLRTLLAPWQRLKEKGIKGNLQSYFEAFIITTLMRLVGALIKIILIILGLACCLFVFVVGIVVTLLWAIVPFLIGALGVVGVTLLIF